MEVNREMNGSDAQQTHGKKTKKMENKEKGK